MKTYVFIMYGFDFIRHFFGNGVDAVVAGSVSNYVFSSGYIVNFVNGVIPFSFHRNLEGYEIHMDCAVIFLDVCVMVNYDGIPYGDVVILIGPDTVRFVLVQNVNVLVINGINVLYDIIRFNLKANVGIEKEVVVLVL